MVTAVKNKLMYNSALRTLLQSYLSLCISAVVSLSYADNALQGTTGLILLVLLVICPIGVVYTLTRKRLIPIDHPMTKAKLDSLYLNVETNGKWLALLHTPLFLVRRLFFALAVVILSGSPLLQIFTTMHVSLVLILFYVTVWPMEDTANNVLQLSNEVFFYTCTCFLLVFSEYTVDPVKRYQIGWVFLGILAANIIANILVIASTLASKVKDYCKKRQLKIDQEAAKAASQKSAFNKKKAKVREFASALEQIDENPHLRSEGSLRSPGMPLPPSLLLQAPDLENRAQLQVVAND